MRIFSRLWKRHIVGALIGGGIAVAIMFILLQKPPKMLVVVEEHHEVLPYWIEAAESGLLPFGGVTLIHIDGHSDDALLEMVPNMPMFTWPQTDAEIGAMLQSNDVFIPAAVLIGLVDRIIWVLPEWATYNHSTDELYDKLQRHLGITNVRGENRTTQEALCACEFDADELKRVCVYLNHSKNPQERDPETVMKDFRQCKPIRTYNFEVITAQNFKDFQMMESKMVQDDEKLILDIDEDYFGCTLPGAILKKENVPFELPELEASLDKLLCPKHMAHEEVGGTFLKGFLHKILQFNQINDKHSVIRISPDNFIKVQKFIINEWLKHPSLFCGRNDLQVRKSAETTIKLLQQFNSAQLRALMHVGFCLNSSPIVTPFEDLQFVVCKGNNDPDNSMVEIHAPTEQEVERALSLLDDLFAILPVPEVVSVCRSVRDGYTPRNMFKAIEDGLFDILRRHYVPGTYKYKYDENLLFGELGVRSWDA